jgi:broad specificity phosphatase PhoE
MTLVYLVRHGEADYSPIRETRSGGWRAIELPG